MRDELPANPEIPHYKHKTEGRNCLSYETKAISHKEYKKGIIKLSGTEIRIPFINKELGPVKEVKITPKLNCYEIGIVYDVKESELKTNKNLIGIDLGINNLCAITNNIPGEKYFLINGKPIKSINQYYNKKLAEFKSLLPKEIYSSRGIRRLTTKRNNKIRCEIHKITRKIVEYCLSVNISTIIVGYNKEWKDECNMGKKNNQKFVQIPFLELLNILTYKARLKGITVVTHEESYTSKCSYFDREEMCHHEKYMGRRVKRGQFKMKDGTKINADCQGSLNIIRKVVPEFFEGDRGFAVNPKKVTYLTS
jgi:IS605 OrfB family transposase